MSKKDIVRNSAMIVWVGKVKKGRDRRNMGEMLKNDSEVPQKGEEG
jgi:hypothetical protein